MNYTVKSVLILAAVAVVSFFVAQAVLPDRNAPESGRKPFFEWLGEKMAAAPAAPEQAAAPVPPRDSGAADTSCELTAGLPAAAPAAAPAGPDASKAPAAQAPDTVAKTLPAQAEPAPAAPNPRARASALRAEQAVVCTAVANRTPQGTASKFSRNTKELYYFTHIIGARDTAGIEHRWYRDGKLVHRPRREVKSPSWRTNTRLLLGAIPEPAGNWRVEVVDLKTGAVLESASFVVE